MTNKYSNLQSSIKVLDEAMQDTSSLASGLEADLQKMNAALSATRSNTEGLEKALSRGLKRAIDGAVLDGQTFSQSMRQVGQSLINAAYTAAVKPVTQHAASVLSSGMLGVFGNAFTSNKVQPFADGGIVNAPTLFPMRSGTGLMGEAGPEAIMPLSRGPDGKLGVRSAGGTAPVNIVMNISTPDAESFRRSQSQIAAQMSRALGQGQKYR
jgi:phage-related minor tail protein